MKIKRIFIVRAMEAKFSMVIMMKVQAIFIVRVMTINAHQRRLLLSCSIYFVTRVESSFRVPL